MLKGDEPGEHFTLVDMTLQTFSYTARVSQSINEKARYIIGFQGMFMDNKNGDAPDKVLPDARLNDFSAYGLFQFHLKSVKLEAGIRYSFSNIDVPWQEAGEGHGHGEEEEHEEHEEDEETKYIQYDGQFDNISASLGATWNINASA